MVELGSALELHKRLVRVPTIGLRRAGNRLRLTSSNNSGLVLSTSMLSDGEDMEATVNLDFLLALAKGSGHLSLMVSNGRLIVKGKHIKGEVPALTEEQTPIPRSDTRPLPSQDVRWLRENLRRVTLRDLDRNGLLSAACDGSTWSMSCADDSHGAFVFGRGRSRVAFFLTPGDADVLRVLLDAAGDDDVLLSTAGGLLNVRAGPHAAAIPTVEGKPISRGQIEANSVQVAALESARLRDALGTVAAVAAANDATSVLLKLAPDLMTIAVNSSVGSVEREVPIRCKTSMEIRVNHAVLTVLAAKAGEECRLWVGTEGRDVARISLVVDQDLHLVMLTSI